MPKNIGEECSIPFWLEEDEHFEFRQWVKSLSFLKKSHPRKTLVEKTMEFD
jgi:hypothetical protein